MLPTRAARRNDVTWPIHWLREDFDSLLGRAFGDAGEPITDLVAAYPVDIREDDDAVYVDAELPGFNKNQVDVTFVKGVLTITATREQKQEPKGDRRLTERRYNKIERSFTLSTSIDETKIDAKLADGVLHLTLPKAEQAKPHRIHVS